MVTRAAGGDVKKLKAVTFNSGGESITAALAASPSPRRTGG
jgi:hypothetical protein